jgi:hypothetical protein
MDNGEGHMLQYRLRWEDTSVLVRAFDADLVRHAVRLLDLAPERRDDSTTGSPDILVSRHEKGYRLEMPLEVWDIKREEDLALCFVSLVSSRFLSNYAGTVLHAGAFVVDGEAVVLAGQGRSGKSSLSLAALQLGYQVINDDWVVIDSTETSVRSFPKGLKLRLDGPVLNVPLQEFVSGEILPTSLSQRGAMLDLDPFPMTPGRGELRDYLLGRLNGEEEYRLLVGRRSTKMAPYGRSIPVQRLLLVERGTESGLMPVEKNDMLRAILDQVVLPRPQSTPLGILRFLEPLWHRKRVFRLIVGENTLRDTVAMIAGKNPNLPLHP